MRALFGLLAPTGAFIAPPILPAITSPTAGANFDDDETISVAGTCPDDTAVEIYDGAVKLGDATVTAGSFAFDYNPADGFSGSLALKATGDVTGDSGVVNITVSVEAPAITSPTAGASFDDDATITISGTCPDDTAVEIYDGAVKLGDATVTAGSFAFDYSPTANTAASLSLVAVGDVGGSSASVSISVTIETLAITSPSNADTLSAGASDTISGTCPDDTAVEIYVGGVKDGDATVSGGNFTYGWTVPGVQTGLGIYAVGDNSGSSASISVDVESLINRDTTLSELVASAVFDLDVTLSSSYSGSGQNWSNLVASPADGSVQSAYDAHNGTSTGADTSDFTFNGSADSPDAYWSSDGGDRMKWLSGTTNFIKQLHRTDIAQDWTLVWAGKLPPDGAGAEFAPLIRTGASTGSGGLILEWLYNVTPFWKITQWGNAATVTASVTSGVPTYEEDFVMGIGYDHSAGEVTFWANSASGATASLTFATATANAPENWLFTQSANIANGGRVRAISGFNEKLSDADFAKVAEHYELRHNRSYLA